MKRIEVEDGNDVTRDIEKLMCEHFGLEPNMGNRQYMSGLLMAAEIYAERGQRHGDVWKDSGWKGMLFDMHKKMDRLWNEYMVSEKPPSDLDSAVDLINYTVFFILGKINNNDGKWRWK